MSEYTFEVNEDNFQQEVLESELPVLVDFWAEWCQPCKMIAPIVDEIAEQYNGSIRVGKLNADENQALLMKYGVRGIPTLILFEGGQAVKSIVGYKPKEALLTELTPHLS